MCSLINFALVITPHHADFLAGHLAHQEHSQDMISPGSPATYRSDEKATIETIERADGA